MEFLQTGTWRKFQRKARDLGQQPADLLADLVEAFLAAEPAALPTDEATQKRAQALQAACGIWAKRPESAQELARQVREANRRVT